MVKSLRKRMGGDHSGGLRYSLTLIVSYMLTLLLAWLFLPEASDHALQAILLVQIIVLGQIAMTVLCRRKLGVDPTLATLRHLLPGGTDGSKTVSP